MSAPATASLPPEFEGEIDARGTEPFWAVSIRKNLLVLTRPDHPEVKATAADGRMQGDRAVWSAQFEGKPLSVHIWKAACSDGMSDRSYPFTAEVKIAEDRLKGCAMPAAASN